MSIYGLIIGISLAIGAKYFYHHNQIIPQKLETKFLSLLILFAIIGARVYGVIADWNYFFQHPIQILNLRGGGLGIYGGLIGGLIFILIFSQKHHFNLISILNLITPILPLCQSLGRWGNYFNHEIYSANNQPIWFYESILMIIIYFLIQKINRHQTVIYLISYGIIRFILEFIRTDTIPIGSITFAQILSLLFILFGIIIFKYENTRR